MCQNSNKTATKIEPVWTNFEHILDLSFTTYFCKCLPYLHLLWDEVKKRVEIVHSEWSKFRAHIGIPAHWLGCRENNFHACPLGTYPEITVTIFNHPKKTFFNQRKAKKNGQQKQEQPLKHKSSFLNGKKQRK